MRIKIVNREDMERNYVNSVAKGMGMKNGADRITFLAQSRKQPSMWVWFAVMDCAAGQWVEVETAHLFDAQFNIGDPPGFTPPEGRDPRCTGARVDARYVDAIDFSPEFADVEEYLAAVQKRYDAHWPGSKVSRELANRLGCGVLKDETPATA